MPGNSNLHDSSRNKQDEFYTNLQLIEDELKHYRAHFKGKRVLCNCDDPYESNFFKYFAMNFNALGLKSLTATCYATSPVVYTQLDLFGEDAVVREAARAPLPRKGRIALLRDRNGGRAGARPSRRQPYKIVITEVKDENGDGRIDLADVEWLIKNEKNVLTKLKGDGDFRSAECVALLDEADIPCDWQGAIGVPITFMSQYSPDQFEMVGLLNHGQDNEYDFAVPRINGKTLFKRIIIRRRAEGETK